MTLAKRILAKLARFYRRLKRRPVTTHLPDKSKKYVKKCHKSCGTISDVIEFNDLQSNSFSGDSSQVDTSKNGTVVKIQAEILPVPRTMRESQAAIQRIAAGNEGSADVGTQADGGPILENGISKRAFCRQLDNLLQRTLGYDCSTSRAWSKRDSTFC